jgi:hypothetical protein
MAVLGLPRLVAAEPVTAQHVARARALMQELRAESRRDAKRIAEAYRRSPGALPDREALAEAIRSGRIRRLLVDAETFNVRLRMDGDHPVGEFDRPHQELYAAAHPAALSLLLQIASRVHSTSLDVTSLVRHTAYQRRLGRANANARTSLALHTHGLAFDISILHIPVAAAHEIRDVLRRMRDNGDLFFVAEVRQLVFHVVVAPERAAYHAALFDPIVTVPPLPWVPTALPAGFSSDVELSAVVAWQQMGDGTLGASFLSPMLVSVGAAVAVWRRRRQARQATVSYRQAHRS